MKNLENLSGVKILNKKAQKEINGGKPPICDYDICGEEMRCYLGNCVWC